jgi:hypothetical protein
MNATSLPEYRVWATMKARCSWPKHPNYHNYGGKGVRVCDRWERSFWLFYEDMGPRPSVSHTIDRMDGTKGYEPSNCRWATRSQQEHNKPSRGEVAYRGVRRSRGRYMAAIKKDGVQHYLGLFDTAEEASKAYQLKAAELYGIEV